MSWVLRRCLAVLAAIGLEACGESAPGPVAPSESGSFLTGDWQGAVTIQVDPGAHDAPPGTSGSMTWTFEIVPQTNGQTFRAMIQSAHAWWPITTIASTAIVPGNRPPAQISTHGDYTSPRGCRGTFGSFGVAERTRIDASFSGVDCAVTFTGRLTLTKRAGVQP
jgi:hypothetical protein